MANSAIPADDPFFRGITSTPTRNTFESFVGDASAYVASLKLDLLVQPNLVYSKIISFSSKVGRYREAQMLAIGGVSQHGDRRDTLIFTIYFFDQPAAASDELRFIELISIKAVGNEPTAFEFVELK